MGEKKCLVIMPFDDKLNIIYELAIEPAVIAEGYECIRVDKLPGGGNILKEIIEQVHKAKVVIADLTGNNPNVFYELGISHGLMNNVIMLAQDIKLLPFDLINYKVIKYGDKVGDDKILREKIKEGLQSLDQWGPKSNPIETFLSPDERPVSGSAYQQVKLALEKAERDLESTRNDLRKIEAHHEKYKHLEAENARLQGIRQFAQDFFHKLSGGKIEEMPPSFEDMMERFSREMEEKGEVSVALPSSPENETNSKKTRKKILFRPVKNKARLQEPR